MERKQPHEREQKRGKREGEMCPVCVGAVLAPQLADFVSVSRAHRFIGPHFTGLDKSPGLQPIIAATLSQGAPTSSCS